MLDKARFVVELAGVYHPKLLASGVAVNASPHLSSLLSRQHIEIGSEFLIGVQLHTRIPKRTVQLSSELSLLCDKPISIHLTYHPVALAFRDEFLENFPSGLIKSFCKAISGWMVCS